MPFCTQCGHSNTDDARFCSSCGAALRPPAAAPSPGETSTITISPGSSPARTGRQSEALSTGRPGRGRRAAARLGPARRPARPQLGSRFLLDSDTTTAGRHPS